MVSPCLMPPALVLERRPASISRTRNSDGTAGTRRDAGPAGVYLCGASDPRGRAARKVVVIPERVSRMPRSIRPGRLLFTVPAGRDPRALSGSHARFETCTWRHGPGPVAPPIPPPDRRAGRARRGATAARLRVFTGDTRPSSAPEPTRPWRAPSRRGAEDPRSSSIFPRGVPALARRAHGSAGSPVRASRRHANRLRLRHPGGDLASRWDHAWIWRARALGGTPLGRYRAAGRGGFHLSPGSLFRGRPSITWCASRARGTARRVGRRGLARRDGHGRVPCRGSAARGLLRPGAGERGGSRLAPVAAEPGRSPFSPSLSSTIAPRSGGRSRELISGTGTTPAVERSNAAPPRDTSPRGLDRGRGSGPGPLLAGRRAARSASSPHSPRARPRPPSAPSRPRLGSSTIARSGTRKRWRA